MACYTRLYPIRKNPIEYCTLLLTWTLFVFLNCYWGFPLWSTLASQQCSLMQTNWLMFLVPPHSNVLSYIYVYMIPALHCMWACWTQTSCGTLIFVCSHMFQLISWCYGNRFFGCSLVLQICGSMWQGNASSFLQVRSVVSCGLASTHLLASFSN